MVDLASHIRKIPNFPKPGILFYDISTLLIDPVLFREAVRRMARLARQFQPQVLAAIESRGFLFAAPLALELGIGFVMVRKVGKLPGTVVSHSYDLEYGSDTLQLADGLIEPASRALVVDDLIATGGTARATVELLAKVGAEPVGAVFLIELVGLEGIARLGVPGQSVLQFPA
jgi:adenine phosphoribosyltransferase